ncbi:MAG: hypothetical protein DRJ15_10215 [Bacteroidetes bacterium]|nr:MAG: hypothetical protein DRJ15_10215 [Bacteroidota bacterium]
MRNGDLYKMTSMVKTGTPMEEVLHTYRNRYSADEIWSFFPKKEDPKKAVKKKAARKKVAEAETETDPLG